MVPSKDFFNDDESLEQRPGKGRNFGNKSKDKKRFESQEDFGITKRSSKGRSEEFEEDDEFLAELDDEDLLDEDLDDEDFSDFDDDDDFGDDEDL